MERIIHESKYTNDIILTRLTANFPEEVVEGLPTDVSTGVYYGWAKVDDGPVHKMVMSIGWNPYYKNEKKSMETHILHEFDSDFYGSWLRVIVCGYRRPEKNYKSLGEYKYDMSMSGFFDYLAYHRID